MKQRMVTVFFGISLLIVILIFYKTIILNIGIAIVSAIAVHEIFSAERLNNNKPLLAVCYVFAAAVPFLTYIHFNDLGVYLIFAAVFALFLIMLGDHESVSVEKISVCFLITVLITFSLTGLIVIRNSSELDSIKDLPLFYMAFAFIGAWITDAGGYIFGRLFGKRKLSPKISPKKTVEGAVGGIVLTLAFSLLLLFVYGKYLEGTGYSPSLNYLSAALLSLLLAAVSIVGDLSASIIKRQNHIKDFGTILPGHGGILDRFDSMIFVVPLVAFWMHLFPIVS